MADRGGGGKQPGELFHTEIRSADPAATAEFVQAVLGWTVHDTPLPSYKVFETPGGFEGHIGPLQEGDAAPSATNYVLVADIAQAEAAIEAAGGSIVTPREEAQGRGFYTGFEMPGGIRMVAWQNFGG